MTSKKVTHQARDRTKLQLLSKALSVSTFATANTARYYFENILRPALLLKFHYSNIMQVPQISKIIILAHSVPFNNVKSVSLALEIISGQKVFSTILSDTQGPQLKSSLKQITGVRFSARGAQARLAWRDEASTIVGSEHAASDKSRDVGATIAAPRRSGQKRSETTKQSGNLAVRKVTDRHSNSSYPNSALLCCSLRGGIMYNFLDKLISLRLTGFLQKHSYDYKIQGQEVHITFSNREVRLFPEIQNHFEFFENLKAIQIKLVTSARNERETLLFWTGLKQKEI